MIRRRTRQENGLAAVLLVLLLALPGTAIASEGGGGGDDGGDERTSIETELQGVASRREALQRELKLLSSINLDDEMNEFIDKKETQARINRLAANIEILYSRETGLKTMLDRLTAQNWVKLFRYIQYFTLQSYLGLPPFVFEGMMFQDPLALGAFQIVMMMAAVDPFFRAYFEARYGYLFEE